MNTTPNLAATLHGSQHAAAPPGSPPAFRTLHLTISRAEWGIVQWCLHQHRRVNLDRFANRALLDACRATVAETVRRRGTVPPGIAKDLDLWRNEL